IAFAIKPSLGGPSVSDHLCPDIGAPRFRRAAVPPQSDPRCGAPRLGTDLLARLAITLSLGAAACLALAATMSVPDGIHAGRTIAAVDDPVRLSELALDRSFDAAVAAREIEAALAAGDIELARSFVDLAAERGATVAPARIEKTETAE